MVRRVSLQLSESVSISEPVHMDLRRATHHDTRHNQRECQSLGKEVLCGQEREKKETIMDSDYGMPRELSDLQKLRSTYQPLLPPCRQGTTVRVEFGDATTAADPSGAHTISRIFPHTYGQPLVHFLRETAKVPDAKLITDHPAIRVGVVFLGRQSPGGHNVIWGLLNALKIHNPNRTWIFGWF